MVVEKNLSCESCDYKTADPYKLRTHLKVHTSTEEFSCSQCEYKVRALVVVVIKKRTVIVIVKTVILILIVLIIATLLALVQVN